MGEKAGTIFASDDGHGSGLDFGEDQPDGFQVGGYGGVNLRQWGLLLV
jgi:hypothetical protein